MIVAAVDHLSGLELCIAAVAFLAVFFCTFAYQIRIAPIRRDERDLLAQEADVVRFPPRLRLVQGGLDAAGAEADAVDFDWSGAA